jgi:hypothetical protein
MIAAQAPLSSHSRHHDKFAAYKCHLCYDGSQMFIKSREYDKPPLHRTNSSMCYLYTFIASKPQLQFVLHWLNMAYTEVIKPRDRTLLNFRLIVRCCCSGCWRNVDSEDGGSMFLWNVGIYYEPTLRQNPEQHRHPPPTPKSPKIYLPSTHGTPKLSVLWGFLFHGVWLING